MVKALRFQTDQWMVLLGLSLLIYASANLSALTTSVQRQISFGQPQAEFVEPLQAAPSLDPPAAGRSDTGRITSEAPVEASLPVHLLEPSLPLLEIDRPFLSENRAQPAQPSQASPAPETPERLVIPAIALDAPVIPAESSQATADDQAYQQWLAPDHFAAGWTPSSARLGEAGNSVFIGHHNVHGEVFRDLIDLVEGDIILVYSQQAQYAYVVANKMLLPEKNQPPEVQRENAVWIQPSADERITLVTCWPRESNTHRLVIVARPYVDLQPDDERSGDIR